MTASSLLLILVGVFIILNSPNFVAVLQNKAKVGFEGTKSTNSGSTTTDPLKPNRTPGQGGGT